MFAGPRFNNYKDGFRFGQLGYDLVEKRGLTRYQARIWMNMGSTVLPWAKHVAGGRELVRRAFDAAYRIGDLTFASYSWDQLVTVCLAAGDPLAEVQTECENGIAFARRVRFGLVIELCGAQLGLILTLRGLTPTFGCLDHEDYGELDTERRLRRQPQSGVCRVLLLDAQVAGAFFRRRPCVGGRRRAARGAAALDVARRCSKPRNIGSTARWRMRRPGITPLRSRDRSISML